MAEKETPKFRLSVPWIGAEIALVEPWTFRLFREYRNWDMWQIHGGSTDGSRWGSTNQEMLVTLPAGTVLSVDRIYIRKGAVAYDSLTFYLKRSPDPRFQIQRQGKNGKPLAPKNRSMRFWAKLADVNNIVCQPIRPEGANEETLKAYESFSGTGVRVLEI